MFLYIHRDCIDQLKHQVFVNEGMALNSSFWM